MSSLIVCGEVDNGMAQRFCARFGGRFNHLTPNSHFVMLFNIMVGSSIVVVFDLANRTSFETAKYLARSYVAGVTANSVHSDFPVIVVGISEGEEGRVVTATEARDFFSSLSRPVEYFETNTVTGQGMDQAHQGLSRARRALYGH